MPKNPFNNNGGADPLAGGGQGGAWNNAAAGAGAGGFGNGAGAGAGGSAYEVDEYDVVDIEAPAATAKPTVQKASKIGGVFSSIGGGNIDKREAAVKAREADLKKREAALLAREAAGAGPATGDVKNFPACMPLVHHDIATDIPPAKRSIMRQGFFVLLLTMVALLFNFVAVLIGVIDGAVPSKAMTLVFAAIYLVLGIPGAWILWYSRLYLAMRRDGAFSFATFFCTFLVHIAFCAWAAVAPDISGRQYSFAGILTALELVGDHNLAGIFYFTGFGLWTATGTLSFFYLCAVYAAFRNAGGVERVQYEATQAGVQMAANNAAANARR